MTKTIHIIAGPTASGKSALAIERALALGGAVINVDSRQVYDALPILSAQPSQEDKGTVPHYLYGALHPNETCSAGRWREMAEPLIAKLLEDGIAPIVTGGTGLYIRALTEGLSPIPRIPDDIREAANRAQEEMGNPAFYDALKARDPETAALYHPMHTARLVHAWEMLEATGKGLAYWQSLPRLAPPEDWHFDITIVMPERAVLHDRCNRRFVQMLDQGAMEEVNDFAARAARGEIAPDSIVHKTIGLPALRGLRDGTLSKEDAIASAQAETRQYAKRQSTWFNNQIRPQDNILNITVLG